MIAKKASVAVVVIILSLGAFALPLTAGAQSP